jgi:hypothetical protein
VGLDRHFGAHYPLTFMNSRTLSGWLTALVLAASAGRAAAADEVMLLRVFLTDGSALVSYGEPARVGDRVIFSMPTAATPDPPLHLVDLSAARVDWERTNRYAEAARAAHYISTQAEADYAALSSRMTLALNQLMQTEDAGRRLAIAQNARRMLAAWPQDHYNYRLNEVRQMLSLLDEAIADLRASTGDGRFDLSLAAFSDPPPPGEPLAPAPTPKQTIEQVLIAARAADNAGERTALLATAVASLDRDAAALPANWVATTRAAAKAQLEAERLTDRAYRLLTARIIRLADRQAREADVGSLVRLVDRVHLRDRELGGRRPDMVAAVVAAVEARLDAARKLRLARDRWLLREPAFRQYGASIKASLDLFASLEPALRQIKLLSGSAPASLDTIEEVVPKVLEQARAISPPPEFRAAQALLVSAVQMAGSAGQIRREATLGGDIARAWDASSAAAGALMLGARARSDMQSLLRPPELR